MGRPKKNPITSPEETSQQIEQVVTTVEEAQEQTQEPPLPILDESPFEEEYFKSLKTQNLDLRVKGNWQKMYAYYIDLIFKYSKKTVLDLGCAFGSIASAFADRKATVIGVDISKHATENSPFKNVKLINKPCWDLSDIPSDSIDFVHSMHMFEFIPPDKREEVFSEIQRVCKQDAVLFVILNMGIPKKNSETNVFLSQKFEWDQIAGSFGMLDGARTFYRKLMETRVPGWDFMSQYHWPFLCYQVKKVNENGSSITDSPTS